MNKASSLAMLAMLAMTSVSSSGTAVAGPISWYDYTVSCNKQLTASYNIKIHGCDNKCFEGHECTNCSGWEVRKGSQLMQAGTADKTPCCTHSPSCGTDNKFGCCLVLCLPFGVRCETSNCPGNLCPANHFSKTVSVVERQFHQCAPGGTSAAIPSHKLAVGTRENNSPCCGSHCSNSDPFDEFGSAYAFGYTVSWTCNGQNHTVNDCTMVANSACGNGTCELAGNEHQYNCPEDCEACDPETDPDCME